MVQPQAAPPSSASTPTLHRPRSSHLHVDTETCPWCEQDIPPEKLEEIRGKIAAKEHERTQEITNRLEQQHALSMAQAEAKARTDIEAERRHGAVREISAREEGRRAAEAAAAEKLSQAELQRTEMQAALDAARSTAAEELAASEAARVQSEVVLQAKITEIETSKLVAENSNTALRAQLEESEKTRTAEVAEVRAKAAAAEVRIRQEAAETAEATVRERLAEKDNALAAALAKTAATEESNTALRAQLQESQTASTAELARVRDEAAAAEVRIRREVAETAEAAVRDRLAEKENAVAVALAKAAAAEDQLAKQSDQHALTLKEQLDNQREVLEKDKEAALNAANAKAFDENQKLSNKVADLQRALDKKNADELGEGAEVDLYEALKKEFPDDRINRVGKGQAGADIHHVVLHNGRECGTIVYDSKNHKQFRNEHVTKLAQDQLAARAEHAILSTHKFPQGTSQLHLDNGVLLANPARVVAVVALIRQHMLQTHTLRMSAAERQSKMATLYAFITSERYGQLLARIDQHTDKLQELQVTAKRWHDLHWKKEGEAICSIEKAKGELQHEVNSIIGTAVADLLDLDGSGQ